MKGRGEKFLLQKTVHGVRTYCLGSGQVELCQAKKTAEYFLLCQPVVTVLQASLRTWWLRTLLTSA